MVESELYDQQHGWAILRFRNRHDHTAVALGGLMPLRPDTQFKNSQLERRVLDILERDGGVPVKGHSKELLVQAGRHLMGLFATLRQLDGRLEKRTWDALAGYFSAKQEKHESEEAAVSKDPVTRETGAKKFRRSIK